VRKGEGVDVLGVYHTSTDASELLNFYASHPGCFEDLAHTLLAA